MSGTGTRIVKNGNPDEDQVVFSAMLHWAARVGTGVAIVVLAAAVIGAATFVRRMDKAADSMNALTNAFDTLALETKKDREDARVDRATRALETQQIKARLKAIDKKMD